MKKYWPFYLNQIRRLLNFKDCAPTSSRTIDIIGDGWREGQSALTVATRIIAYELQADEDARNAPHDG